VRVVLCVQVRPPCEFDVRGANSQSIGQEVVWSLDAKTVVGKDPDRKFAFDGVFGPESTNQVAYLTKTCLLLQCLPQTITPSLSC
jgi:hypothetical protein